MRKSYYIFIILFFFTFGCASKNKQLKEGELTTEGKSNLPFIEKVSSALSSDFKRNPPYKVAILPVFPSQKVIEAVAVWNDVEPIQIFRTVFFGRFSVLSFKDVPLKKVDQILAQNNLSDYEKIKNISSDQLGALLGVDALIYLDLNNVANKTGGIHSQTQYDAILRMVDAQTGKEYWRAELKQTNSGGVLSRKASQLADLIEFEKENKNKPLAFRKVAEIWSHRVLSDFKKKWNGNE